MILFHFPDKKIADNRLQELPKKTKQNQRVHVPKNLRIIASRNLQASTFFRTFDCFTTSGSELTILQEQKNRTGHAQGKNRTERRQPGGRCRPAFCVETRRSLAASWPAGPQPLPAHFGVEKETAVRRDELRRCRGRSERGELRCVRLWGAMVLCV